MKGATIHWVDAADAVDAEVRLYDNLFTDGQPRRRRQDFLDYLNPDSLKVLTGCKVEACLADAQPGESYPVPAAGLLLRGQQGLQARRAGVQPFRKAEG